MDTFKYDMMVKEKKERIQNKIIKLKVKTEKLEKIISELEEKVRKLDQINAECDERHQMKAINSYKKEQLNKKHAK